MDLQQIQGLRLAVEGCGHGTLNAIYAATKTACEKRAWPDVDLLIIGGDFQAVRNANDLTVMSCPVKYREIGDFHEYYNGRRVAPYLTIFVGGNHEATSHLRELFYGGWVAPNIYYMGAANVLRLGSIRIAGLSGIWKGVDYNKTHYERLPYNQGDIKSAYHVREIDVRKLLQVRTQVDIGISHDWPRAIEKHGNSSLLWKRKPDFEQESRDGTLGSPAAAYVMDRLRPPYWFAAHLHCKFAATKIYAEQHSAETQSGTKDEEPVQQGVHGSVDSAGDESLATVEARNADEIDLDMDDDEADDPVQAPLSGEIPATLAAPIQAPVSTVSDDVRALLPASFTRPRTQPSHLSNAIVPAGITNQTVRFLALDKCLPGRKFLQLLDVEHDRSSSAVSTTEPTESVEDDKLIAMENDGALRVPSTSPRYRLQYDAEWLAITRTFASLDLSFDDRSGNNPANAGEEHYLGRIEEEEMWVDEHVVKTGLMDIPLNFAITAPIHKEGMPEIVAEQPQEYNNPQTEAFCQLIGIKNAFCASDEEKRARQAAGPAAEQFNGHGGFSGGRGGSRGGRGRGRGRGNGRGGRGGRGGGRGRGW